MTATYRRWRDPADWPAICDAANASYAADDLEIHLTPEEMATERQPNLLPERDLIVAEIDRRVVGAAWPHWAIRDGVLTLDHDGVVRPEVRRRGIGGELLRLAQASLLERTAEVHPGVPRRFSSWVNDLEAGTRAMLEGDGYAPDRYAFEMIRRDLDDVPDLPLPDGLEIRPMSLDHARQVFAAEDEAFRDHPDHRDWTEDDVLSNLENPDFDPSLWQVAWDGDEVAGVVSPWIHWTENERLGFKRSWFHRVSVRRPWRQRGLARALIARAFIAVRERGIEEACLGVDVENPTGALRLYESLGFRPFKTARVYRRPVNAG